MASQKLPVDAPSPRLCLVRKTYDDQEYGFNLHAEKGKGQFIGAVDAGSIAELAGLKPGDRIFAVNGFNIIGVSHKEVVSKIKSDPQQCELLVISEEGADWYERNNIPINMSLSNIIRPCKEEKRTEPKIPSNDHGMNPRPRLCHLEKQNPADEFGFNLHVEKGKGHFIGAVDAGGIGDKAGLEMGQRIVGVNGELVYPHTPHKDVVGLIKRDPLSTDLLVASEEVDRWYTDNAVPYSFESAIVYNRPRGHSKISVNNIPNGSLPQSRKDTLESQKSAEQRLKTITNMPQEESIQSYSLTEEHVETAPVEREIQLDNHGYALPPVETIPAHHDDDLLNQVFSGIPLADLHYVHDAPHKPLEIEKTPEPHMEEVEELHVHKAHLDEEEEEEIHATNGHSHASSRGESPKPAPVWVPPPPPPVAPSVPRTSSPASESSRSNGSSDRQNKHPTHDHAQDIFKLNAKEARQLLVQKKKDPRRQHMTLEQKHDIILNL